MKLTGFNEQFTYAHKGDALKPLPEWLTPFVIPERTEPNRFLLLFSRIGQMRMHVGYVAVLVGTHVYAYRASEVQERLADILLESEPCIHLPNGRQTLDSEAARADHSNDTDDVSYRARG